MATATNPNDTGGKKVVNVKDEFIGIDVINREGKNLGEIKTVMLDKLTGQVAYVVLSYGGLWGLGDKLFALPWEMFTYDENKECFLIDADEEMLKNSPGFDEDHWPNMSDPSWGSSIHQYYHTIPGSRRGSTGRGTDIPY